MTCESGTRESAKTPNLNLLRPLLDSPNNRYSLCFSVMAELKPVLPLVHDEISYLRSIHAFIGKRYPVLPPTSHEPYSTIPQSGSRATNVPQNAA
jgi:hypothetical protein